MKNFLPLRPLLALILSAAPVVGMAVPLEIPGAVSTVTVALTLSRTVEGTVKKSETTGKPLTGDAAGPDYDNEWAIYKNEKIVERGEETVTKIAVSKYSNKELLLDLKNVGLITDVKGWSVSKVQATLPEPVVTAVGNIVKVQNGPVRYYLTHKTLAPIAINGYVGGGGEDFLAAVALNSKRLTKFNAAEEPSSDVTTHTLSYKTLGNFRFNFMHEETVGENHYLVRRTISVTGPVTGGEKLAFYGPQKLQVLLPTAGKMGPLSGFSYYTDGREEIGFPSVVEGSVTFGAGVVKNVGAFPDVTVDPEPES